MLLGAHESIAGGVSRAFARAEAHRTGLPAIAHGSYLVNLGTEDAERREKSLACVVEELTRCERLGIPSLVIHPGCHEDERRGLQLIAQGLDEVHRRTPGFRAERQQEAAGQPGGPSRGGRQGSNRPYGLSPPHE